MVRKVIYITGSAIIGVIALLSVMFTLIGTGAIKVDQTKLVISSQSAEAVYSGEPLTAGAWELVDGELREGHTLKVVVSGSQTTAGVSPNSISATVTDKNGADVTDHYDIEYQPGTLTVTQRALEITAGSDSKVYDGTPLTLNAYTITAGELVEGHTLSPVINGTITDVGIARNAIAASILDASGTDVTSSYAINAVSGTLTVTKRPLDLQSDSTYKMYDGTALEGSEAKIVSGSVADGHTIVYHSTSSITNAGDEDNKFTVEILDADGINRIGNYSITYHYGILTVLPVPITISTGGGTKVYDGKPLTNDKWEIIHGELVGNDRLDVVLDASVTFEGSVDNIPKIAVYNEYGDDVTQNYDFLSSTYGRLIVTKNAFTITSASSTRLYDATPLQNKSYTLAEGYTLPEGHQIIPTFTASITNAGTVKNAFTIIIVNAEGVDVTANFTPKLVQGELTVVARPITIVVDGATKVYDGTALTCDKWSISSSSVLVGNDYAELVFTKSRTEVGSTKNTPEVKIYNEHAIDVTKNYACTLVVGDLVVTKNRFTVTSASDVKVYDATPLTNPDYSIVHGNIFPEGYTVKVDVSGSAVNAGEEENVFEVTVRNADGIDVSANFDITKNNGTLTVLKRNLVVATDSATKVYDGKPMKCERWSMLEGSTAGNDTITATFPEEITNVGSKENTPIFTVTDEFEIDVTDNYSFSVIEGTLTVTKNVLTVISASDQKTYDATPLTKHDYSVSEGYILPDGHEIIPSYTGGITNAGEAKNYFTVIVIDGEGNDVTKNFSLEYIYGTLTVSPVQITIATVGAEKSYDGTPLRAEGWDIIHGSTVGEDVIHVKFEKEQTEVGYTKNTPTITVTDENDNDVTENYAFTVQAGILTVTKSAAWAKSASTSKIYDASPLTLHQLDSYSILPGYTIIPNYSGSITNVGEAKNLFTATVVDENGIDVTKNFDVNCIYGALTVTPLEITVSTAGAEKTYDGTPLKASEKASEWEIKSGAPIEGDVITLEFTAEITDVGSKNNTPTIKVIDKGDVEENDVDVTKNYRFTVQAGKLVVTKNVLTVISASDQKTYDATPLTKHDYSVSEGYILPDGHEIIPSYTASITNAGEVKNYFTVTVVNADGRDVTPNFDVEYVYGLLTVAPVNIIIATDGAEKTYDGTALRTEGWHIVSGVTVGLDRIVAEFPAERINVGSTDNIPVIIVLNENDRDVTSNYTFTVQPGELIVNKCHVVIESVGAQKEYDATPLTHHVLNESYVLPTGHTLAPSFTGSVTNAETKPNRFTVRISNGKGDDVTANFDIEYVYGSLTVTPLEINVVTGSKEKIYDGTPLSHYEYTIVEPLLDPRYEVTMDSEITDVGSVDNVPQIKVYSASGTEATSNYKFIVSAGKLTVSPRPITVTSESFSKVYDGSALTSEPGRYSISSPLFDTPLVDGHTEALDFTSSQTEAGWAYNDFDIRITDGSRDVTGNYIITKHRGTLTVIKRRVVITTKSVVFEYDGEEHCCHDYSVDSATPLPDGYEITSVVFSSNATVRDVDKVKNEIADLVIEKDGVDKTQNFEIVYALGYVSVTPRVITIRTSDGSKVYDGTPLTNDAWEVVSITKPLEHHEIIVAVSGTRTEIGESKNEIAEIIITDTQDNGREVTHNYEIQMQLGALTVKAPDGPGDGGSDEPDVGDGPGGNPNGDLRGSGNKPSGALCFEIYSEVSGTVYLRQKSFGDFAFQGWEEATQYSRLLDGKYSYNYLSSIAIKNSGVSAKPMTIRSKLTSSYYLPYFLEMSERRYVVPSSDVLYTGDGADEYSLYYLPYNGNGSDIMGMLGEYSDEEEAYYGFVWDNYRALDDDTRACMDGIIAEQGFDKSQPDIIARVATYIRNIAKYNMDYNPGLDESENAIVDFLTVYNQGVCRHYASAATALFRALDIPARYTVGFAAETEAFKWVKVTDAQAHAWVEVYVKGVGWLPVEVTGSNSDDTPTPPDDTEEKDPLKITVRPQTVYHAYDGRTAYANDAKLSGLADLLERGYTYEAVISGSRMSPGKSETRIESFTLYDPNNNDVTSQFKIKYETGTLHVYLSELTVRTYSSERVYDGTGLTNERIDISGTLLDGHTVATLKCTGMQTDVGKSSNGFEIVIIDSQGKDVTDHYKINKNLGTLSITARAIHVTAKSAEKDYDDTPLVLDEYELSGTLADGDTLYVKIVGSQTNPGYSLNKIQSISIKNQAGVDVTSNYKITQTNGQLTVNW